MNELKLKKAMDTLEFSIQDQEARMQYEARQKYLHDQASLMEAAKNAEKYGFRAGMEKGIEQGIEQGIRQTALRLLRRSMAIPDVAAATGLSEEEVTTLYESLN